MFASPNVHLLVSSIHYKKIVIERYPPPKKKGRGRANVINILNVSCLCEELTYIVNKGSSITAVEYRICSVFSYVYTFIMFMFTCLYVYVLFYVYVYMFNMFICLFINVYMCICLYVHMFICYMFICLYVYIFICLYFYMLNVYMFICLNVYMFICLNVYTLSVKRNLSLLQSDAH